jgi:hypothetical protein
MALECVLSAGSSAREAGCVWAFVVRAARLLAVSVSTFAARRAWGSGSIVCCWIVLNVTVVPER